MHLISSSSVFSLLPSLFLTDICHKTSGYSPSGPHLLLPSCRSHSRDEYFIEFMRLESFWEEPRVVSSSQVPGEGGKNLWVSTCSSSPTLTWKQRRLRPWVSLESVSTSPFSPQNQELCATRHKAQWIIPTEIRIKGVVWVPVHELPMSRCRFPKCARY